MPKQRKNFMDYVPRHNKNYTYSTSKDNIVTVNIVWKGPYHKIATVLFHKPAESHIDLDKVGSYIWLQMDGVRTVLELSELLSKQFPDLERPVDRLAKFLTLLHNNQFIVYNTPEPVEKAGK